jgi:hypothetical protein
VNCFDPSDQDQTDERERGNLTVVARVPVRLPGEDAVLERNVGAAPMVLGGDGDQDKMQNGEGSSET